MRAFFRNWPVVLMVVTLGLGVWLAQWRTMREREKETASLRERLAILEKESNEAEMDLGKARGQTEKGKREETEAWDAEARARRKLEKVDPDARWATPPAGTPEWNASPYVWMPKGQLTNFGMAVFQDDGRLTGNAAAALAVDPETLKKLDGELAQYVAEYRVMEATNAERVDGAANGVSTNGMTVRVKSLPDAANQFVTEVQGSLEDTLGSQRAGLLMQMGQGWLSGFGQGEKTYSVDRAGNGYLSIRVEGPGSSMSTQIPADNVGQLGWYIPANIMPMFTAGMDLSNTGAPQ